MGFAITPITGKAGRFQVAGSNISIESEDIEFSVERIDVTGTEDQRASGETPQNITHGVIKMSGTINGSVNADDLITGILGIQQGDVITNVKFFLDKNVAARWCGASQSKILAIKYMHKIRDAWKFSFQIESTGGFDCVITHPS